MVFVFTFRLHRFFLSVGKRWQAGTGETIKGIWFVREGNLVVENATRGHAGRYECLARNPLGEARMEYRLRVVGEAAVADY